MPEFIMLIAPAGAGKSTYARSLSDKYIVVSSDAVRKRLYGDEAIQGSTNKVFNLVHRDILVGLSDGHDVVLDATNLTEKKRIGLLKQIPVGVTKTAVVIATPPDIIYAQNASRQRVVPKEVIFAQLSSFMPPSIDEGFDEIKVVRHGNLTVEDIHKPCIGLVDNSHHKLDVESHMQKTAEMAKKDGLAEFVVNVLRHHDVGKPATMTIDEDGERHCYGHHFYGSYLALCAGLDLVTVWFIAHHMDLYFSSIEVLEKKYGSQVAAMLTVINEYDKANA